MCTIIVPVASATRSEEKWEGENREEAHQTEEEERGMEQTFCNKLETGTSKSESVSQQRAWLTGREGQAVSK